MLRAAGFPLLNLDLIYGLPGQDARSFERSLARLLEVAPEEVFLYPLYVRPLTGLGVRGVGAPAGDDLRLARGVREILAAWVGRDAAEHAAASYGFELDGEEQGLSLSHRARRFAGADPCADLPQLRELEPLGLVERRGDALALTPAGLERSDVLGPWLASARVEALLQDYEPR